LIWRRRRRSAAIILPAIPSTAYSLTDIVGIYADPDGSTYCTTVLLGMPTDLYVVATNVSRFEGIAS